MAAGGRFFVRQAAATGKTPGRHGLPFLLTVFPGPPRSGRPWRASPAAGIARTPGRRRNRIPPVGPQRRGLLYDLGLPHPWRTWGLLWRGNHIWGLAISVLSLDRREDRPALPLRGLPVGRGCSTQGPVRCHPGPDPAPGPGPHLTRGGAGTTYGPQVSDPAAEVCGQGRQTPLADGSRPSQGC